MTKSTDARDIAVDGLEATKALIDHLDGLHAELHAERDGRGTYVARETVLARQIGEARDVIRYGLKFAEINALVAISDRLTELVVLGAERPKNILDGLTDAQVNRISELVAEYHERSKAKIA